MTQLTDELLFLEELCRTGSLTPDEFTLAKARLLTGNADTSAVAAQAKLAEETSANLRRLELQNRLMAIENAWRHDEESLIFHDGNGISSVPMVSNAVTIAVVGGVAALLLAVGAAENVAPGYIPLFAESGMV